MTPNTDSEEGPGLFSWPFWAGGAASLAVWTAIWWTVAAILDRIPGA